MASSKKNLQLIKAFVRSRPLTNNEKELNYSSILQTTSVHELVIRSGTTERKYLFDQVFTEQASQEEIYEGVVSPLIDFSISGYNCTVFAYGQTGTGKTYTMIGDANDSLLNFNQDSEFGLIPRAASHLFASLSTLGAKYTVLLSFLEIYNEEVRDLLAKDGVPLKIYEDPENKGSTCIRGLTEKTVFNANDVYDLLNVGIRERQTAATNLNRHSSRSHTIFTLQVCTREITSSDEEIIRSGKLNLIDLAGSENINRSGATEMRAREAGTINKSLLTLGKVIKALAQKMSHIPYRDSKLTRILQDSLGGNAKTSMIATFSPCPNCWDETLSTLDYARDARRVAISPTVNVNRKPLLGLKRLKDEIASLRQEIAALRKAESFYISRECYDALANNVAKKQEQICRLQEEMQRITEIIRDKERQFQICRASFDETNSYLASIENELQTRTEQQAKNDNFIKYMSQRQNELKEKNVKLRTMCTVVNEHVDILMKKYDAQCNFSLQNANIASNTHSNTSQCLKEIDRTTTSLRNENINNLDLIIQSLSILHNLFRNLEAFREISKELEVFGKTTCILNLKQILNDYVGKLQKILNLSNSIANGKMNDTRNTVQKLCNFINDNREQSEIMLTDLRKYITNENDKRDKFFELFKSTLDKAKQSKEEIQELVQEQNEDDRNMKEMFLQYFRRKNQRNDKIRSNIALYQNTYKPMLFDLTKEFQTDNNVAEGNACLARLKQEHEDIGKNEVALIDEAASTFKKNQNTLKAEVSTAGRDVNICATDFHAALQAEIIAYNTANKSSLLEIHHKQTHFGKDFQIHTEENIEIINKALRNIVQSTRQQDSGLTKYIESNMEELNKLKGNIIRVHSSGDTPSRGNFKLSPRIDRRLSINTLFKQIKENGFSNENVESDDDQANKSK